MSFTLIDAMSPRTANTCRVVRTTACLAIVLALAACAHPISIEAKRLPERESQPSPKKAVYVITEADKQKQVTTEGGGGDKISYYPYRDFERALRASLAAVYSDVSAIGSPNDVSAIQAAGASFVFLPEITTTSSSPSPFTWPPTRFSMTVTVNVSDATGMPLTRFRATGNGNAEWEEFKGDFGLAGRRAVESAAQALVTEIKKSEKLR